MRGIKDVVVIGLALFAMFFGAGNLIFPPKLGVISGDQWWVSALGFFTTDVVLSLLGIIAVAKAGGDFDALAGKVGRRFAYVMGAVIMLSVGPLLAIPRTGAVGYEMGFTPLVPGVDPLIFTALYFGLALVFVLDPKGIIDKIGTWLTPVLLISLVVIIVKNIISPLGAPSNSIVDHEYSNAFQEGYQTLDGLASVILAGMILMTLKQKGYKDASSQVKMSIRAGIIAFGIIGLVYGGLIYLGACGSGVVDAGMNRTGTFMALVNGVMGEGGIWIMAIAVIFACFTTTVGLTATVAEYFNEVSKGKLSYRLNVVVITMVSFLLSNLGVEQIVRFSGPLLGILYPAVVVLIVLMLIDRWIPRRSVYAGAVYGTLVYGVVLYLCSFYLPLLSLRQWLCSFPLSDYDMGWMLPAVLGGAFGYLIDLIYTHQNMKSSPSRIIK